MMMTVAMLMICYGVGTILPPKETGLDTTLFYCDDCFHGVQLWLAGVRVGVLGV